MSELRLPPSLEEVGAGGSHFKQASAIRRSPFPAVQVAESGWWVGIWRRGAPVQGDGAGVLRLRCRPLPSLLFPSPVAGHICTQVQPQRKPAGLLPKVWVALQVAASGSSLACGAQPGLLGTLSVSTGEAFLFPPPVGGAVHCGNQMVALPGPRTWETFPTPS